MTRILIIEDEKPMAESIKYSLEKEGYEADLAFDGEAGGGCSRRSPVTCSYWT